jgi:hypothetical protein
MAKDPNDTNLYTFGRIGGHNVVIACRPAGQMGKNLGHGGVCKHKFSTETNRRRHVHGSTPLKPQDLHVAISM